MNAPEEIPWEDTPIFQAALATGCAAAGGPGGKEARPEGEPRGAGEALLSGQCSVPECLNPLPNGSTGAPPATTAAASTSGRSSASREKKRSAKRSERDREEAVGLGSAVELPVVVGDMGRRLTPEEVEAIRHTITPIERIRRGGGGLGGCSWG